ncbi:uncharacterized protein DNG_04341 [Cephalotrichum gorgonifer]|uniref:F-box domain-containing protein n=1 Tax=Cephalotrichum gorgonifer TaxID=2041049 RepID=A0AAE8MWW6_9PEZI|nr:uncharacterized protein DNG_04341 [Cephalotrichum gorgonifer]
MGSFECYCAGCGGSLTGFRIQVGSSAPSALARRRKIVRSKCEAPIRDATPDSDSDSDEEDSDEEDDWNEDDEDQSYDPSLVDDMSVQWLNDLRCLGYNSEIPGIRKAFITGEAEYDDNDAIFVSMGNDPNQPVNVESYFSRDSEHTPVFPFHNMCLGVLARTLTGSSNFRELNHDVLYAALSSFVTGFREWTPDYGGIAGPGQSWESIPGEEFSVTSVASVPDFEGAVHFRLAKGVFSSSLSSPNHIAPRRLTGIDPFAKLPMELLQAVSVYLPGKSVLALRQASFAVYSATQGSDFWKWYLPRDMPWFWELNKVMKEVQTSDVNYKSLYLWLNASTAPKFGTRSPFMGIANRRRIWSICETIMKRYLRFMSSGERAAKRGHHTSEEILEALRGENLSGDTFVVASPMSDDDTSAVSTHLIRWWEDLEDLDMIFCTYWNSDRLLVGIGIEINGTFRLIGRRDTVAGDRRSAVRIGANDWITGLILHITKFDPLGASARAGVQGVSVLRGSATVTLGATGGGQRPLLTADGRCLIGLSGQIREDGVITRLGLLQCPRPSKEGPTSDFLEPTIEQRLLWDGGRHMTSPPIWQHPSLRLVPLVDGKITLHPDLISHEILHWIKDKSEIRKLEEITVRIGTRPTQSGADIIGIRVQQVRNYWEPRRYVGARDVYGDRDPVDYPEMKEVQHFKVDGPGGEYITEVAAATTCGATALKLTTNRGKSTSFGADPDHEWSSICAPEGAIIVGLAVTFATAVGSSYPGLSNVLVLVSDMTL